MHLEDGVLQFALRGLVVDGIDDALKEIEAEGGSTVTPRTQIPGMGAFAYFKDPEGNVLGLWETTP